MSPLDEAILSSLGHRRYGSGFVPLWRIREDLPDAPTPAAVYRALRRLEERGLVESRLADRVVLWRIAPAVAPAPPIGPRRRPVREDGGR